MIILTLRDTCPQTTDLNSTQKPAFTNIIGWLSELVRGDRKCHEQRDDLFPCSCHPQHLPYIDTTPASGSLSFIASLNHSLTSQHVGDEEGGKDRDENRRKGSFCCCCCFSFSYCSCNFYCFTLAVGIVFVVLGVFALHFYCCQMLLLHFLFSGFPKKPQHTIPHVCWEFRSLGEWLLVSPQHYSFRHFPSLPLPFVFNFFPVDNPTKIHSFLVASHIPFS